MGSVHVLCLRVSWSQQRYKYIHAHMHIQKLGDDKEERLQELHREIDMLKQQMERTRNTTDTDSKVRLHVVLCICMLEKKKQRRHS
jgi:hypothetical protein